MNILKYFVIFCECLSQLSQCGLNYWRPGWGLSRRQGRPKEDTTAGLCPGGGQLGADGECLLLIGRHAYHALLIGQSSYSAGSSVASLAPPGWPILPSSFHNTGESEVHRYVQFSNIMVHIFQFFKMARGLSDISRFDLWHWNSCLLLSRGCSGLEICGNHYPELPHPHHPGRGSPLHPGVSHLAFGAQGRKGGT